MSALLHKQVTATVTDTDLGEFTALAATWEVDRTKERIIRGAFSETIKRWRASAKRIPLHYDHRGDADAIIGVVFPESMSETEDGLEVSGQLDLDRSETAREAWRTMKNGAMSLSFGYKVDKARRGAGGIKELLALDLFEVSLTPAPANADTRVLAMKGAIGSLPVGEAERRAQEEFEQSQSMADAIWAQREKDLADRKMVEELATKKLPPIKTKTFEY